MKNSIFKLLAILIVLGLTLHSCNKSETISEEIVTNSPNNKSVDKVLIGNQEGEIFFNESVLLEAFNSVSEHKATEIVFGSLEGDQYSVFFRFTDNSGMTIQLEQQGKNFYLKHSALLLYHTCTGAPCNSCKLLSSFLIITGCSCTQSNCSDCACNHTVSTKESQFTSEDVVQAYLAGL